MVKIVLQGHNVHENELRKFVLISPQVSSGILPILVSSVYNHQIVSSCFSTRRATVSYLVDFLIPGSICYLFTANVFVPCGTDWLLRAYGYRKLSEAEQNSNQKDVLGNNVVDLKVVVIEKQLQFWISSFVWLDISRSTVHIWPLYHTAVTRSYFNFVWYVNNGMMGA